MLVCVDYNDFGDSLNIFWEVLVTVLEGEYLTFPIFALEQTYIHH